MFDIATLITFSLTVLVIELTPGPNMAWLAVLSATEGRRAGFAAVGGVATGLSLVGVAAALGLGAVIERSDILYGLLRWGGVGFLFYLAWEGWREAGRPDAQERASARVKELLATHTPEPLEADVATYLHELMGSEARRYGMEQLPGR